MSFASLLSAHIIQERSPLDNYFFGVCLYEAAIWRNACLAFQQRIGITQLIQIAKALSSEAKVLFELLEEDPDYGTNMAKLLHHAQEHGFKTSLDVVSETGDRFRRLVHPALKYTDYCIINELEAQQTTGVRLRDEDGTLHPENLRQALERMKELGCGLDEQ